MSEIVTDGATYTSGNNVTDLFYQYTTYNVGTGYDQRHVWYPYYNYSTGIGYGAAASGYGATEAPTTAYNPETGREETDYHNTSKASHTQLASKVIDLSCTAQFRLLFDYTSTSQRAGTWEIKNLRIVEK